MHARSAHLLLAGLVLALAACGGGTAASPSPVPAPTPVMPVASTAVATPGAATTPTEPEAALLHGARLDLQGTCAPLRAELPADASGAIECTTASDAAGRVVMVMFDAQAQLVAAYDTVVAAQGIERFTHGGRCEPAGASEGGYVPGDGHPGLEPVERSACWTDEAGTAHYAAAVPPFILLLVDGRPGTTISGTELFAWLGNQDQPGGPTLWATEPMSPEK